MPLLRRSLPRPLERRRKILTSRTTSACWPKPRTRRKRSNSSGATCAFRQLSIEIQHRLQQNLGALGALLLGGELLLVVADAVLAGYEDHARWRDTRDVNRIVQRTRRDIAVRIPT